jgi:glycosyltransferase involved in cell wall biosynthesis
MSFVNHPQLIKTPKKTAFLTAENSRILLLSMREIADLVAYCCLYEFEDVISALDTVDTLKPLSHYDVNTARKIYKLANHLTHSTLVANSLVPKLNPFLVDKEYDLFFPVFNSPFELFSLYYLKNWRKKCKKAVCYIAEVWEQYIQKSNKYLLKFLKDFDHIFLGVSHTTEIVTQMTGRPCTYLPPGVDALKFCPYPLYPHRSIDVCSLGRRSPVTHQALLALAEQGQIFYYYDTLKTSGLKQVERQQTFHVNNPREHRLILANLTKISRYFIANRANANEPYLTRGKEEIGYRFFEGAAAGTVMLGDPPATDKFNQYFNWQDAVIKIPFDAPNIGEIIAELDAQPERLAKIRRDNVVNSLLQHDWVYRLKEVYQTVGLQPTINMLSREAQLKELAYVIAPLTQSLDRAEIPQIQVSHQSN